LLKKAIRTLDNFIERVAHFSIYIAGGITLLMALVTTFGVVMRYVFKSPEHYTYEIGIFCLISSVSLALAYIQKQGRNLRVDFVSNFFPQKLQAALLDILIPLVALFYLVLLVRESWGDAWYSLGIGERTYSAWAPPVGPMKLIVPIGAGLLCIVLISQLIHGLVALKKDSAEKTH
jgi:TRAP-type C4-dicarboxylate transport system permease small subunit